MDCEEARTWLPLSLDDELEVAAREELEAHLGGCAPCAQALHDLQHLSAAVRGSASRFRAGADLIEQIVASLPASEPTVVAVSPPAPRRRLAQRWLPLAASLLLTAGLSSALTFWISSNAAMQRTDENLIAAHVRSLMVDHLTDVASSDQHTVRPWFAGRIDVAPPVRDLAAEGFPLVGGRLDYLDSRATAALVYRHGPHLINVFVRPAPESPSTPPAIHSYQGYLIAEWSQGGLTYKAVSDLNAEEMSRLAHLLFALPQGSTSEGRRPIP